MRSPADERRFCAQSHGAAMQFYFAGACVGVPELLCSCTRCCFRTSERRRLYLQPLPSQFIFIGDAFSRYVLRGSSTRDPALPSSSPLASTRHSLAPDFKGCNSYVQSSEPPTQRLQRLLASRRAHTCRIIAIQHCPRHLSAPIANSEYIRLAFAAKHFAQQAAEAITAPNELL